MSGRGFLFPTTAVRPEGQRLSVDSKSISNSNSSDKRGSVEDSGLGTKSLDTADGYRQIGRGRILDDVSEQFSKLEMHEKRGDSIEFEDHGSGGRCSGRGFILQSFEQATPSGSQWNVKEKVITRKEKSPQMEKVEVEEKSFKPLFKPNVIHGTKGTPIRMVCNYIRLSCEPTKGVYMYEVRFHPNVDSINLRMKYLNEHRDKFGGTKTFDGVTLYLPIMLENALNVYVSKNVADNTDIEIRVMFKRKESLQSCIHLYNVLFNRVMKALHYVRFDRKQFDPTSPKIIPHAKLEVWPGYVTAVDEYEGDLMLCCDVSHRILCQKSVLETLVDIYREDRGKHQFEENAKKHLLGAVVITHYNNQTYRIDDIYFDKNPTNTFSTRDGPISFVDYYRKHYNIEIKDHNQPLLGSIRKQRGPNKEKAEEFIVCLIPEICHLTGLIDEMRSDFKLMREIASHTRVSPNQRLLALQKFYTNIDNCKEAREILSNWGLSLKSSPETITGRQMQEEQVIFANKVFAVGPTADFSRYAVNNELIDVVNLNNWLLLHCKIDQNVASAFCKHMERNSKAMGINVKKPRVVVLENDRVDTYVNALRSHISSDTEIVVCICPKSRDDRYATIKKICCSEIPVPSQVINARTLLNETKNRSIVQKIALQINCKLGGSLWTVKIPLKNVMICGIDSYHDAAQKSNSVAAFVASLNSTYTKWYSKSVIQTKGEEIVNGLCSSFIASLLAYEKVNGKLPDNVIIYRDGVGDGQLQLCVNYEVKQLESAYRQAYPAHECKLTFIVVQKRINTRFFLKTGTNAANPQPGTVVDSTITRKHMYDFFLVSQSVHEGTVTPSHYVVLRDDANYSPDILQRLSYKLCFLYYNWPGTIRIPACCQYAHKFAYLVGQSIRRGTSEQLADKLFYL